MRILFISTTFPDSAAPARGTYNAALCRALADGHQVRVIAPRSFPEVVRKRFRCDRYQLPEELYQAGVRASYPTFWYTPRIWQEHSGGQMWRSVRSAIEHAVVTFQPQAVLSYWAHPEGEVGLRTGQLARIPSAVIVGGSDVLILPGLPRRGPRVRSVLSQSDAVITVSDGLKNSVQQLGVSADRVRTIYQGIDPEQFHHHVSREQSQRRLGLDGKRKHLVWVGRMVSVKALDVLIDAAGILRSQGCQYQLHLIGDGPERMRIEKRVMDEGLSDVVRCVGAVGHDHIADWYRAADLTVLCSDSEGLPNVLRESLACGTPFVATDVGSLHEIADPAYSCLVPQRDAQAFATAILESLSSERHIAASAYSPRTWKQTADETVNLFSELIQSRRNREALASVASTSRTNQLTSTATS